MQPTRNDNHGSAHEFPLGATHQCAICFKSYKRLEHLQRHRNSHAADRPHQCPLCPARFQRTDVLKRHRRTCTGRASRGTRTPQKRRACDQCVRKKKACNSCNPCNRCSSRAIECYYSGDPIQNDGFQRSPNAWAALDGPSGIEGSTESSTEEGTLEELLHMSSRTMEPSIGPQVAEPGVLQDVGVLDLASPSWQDLFSMVLENPSGQDGRHAMQFLHRFTSTCGLVESFECGTEQQRKGVWLEIQREIATCGKLQTMSGFPLLPNVSCDPGPSLTQDMPGNFPGDGVPPGWLNDPLSLKTHQILSLIREIVTIKPRNSAVILDWSLSLQQSCLQFFSPTNLRKFLGLYFAISLIREIVTIKPRNSAVILDWSLSLQQSCLQFFSPTNLRKFLGLYFAIWHPNVNFVHRPSFDMETAKPAVLAAMAVIGACVSPDKTDNDDVRIWFDCVDELVFTDEDFNNDMANLNSMPIAPRRDKVQALQAAFMVCLYQNWQGSDASKRRIRRRRFATLVSAARDIDLTTVRHIKYSEKAKYEFEWKDFATREELIRVLIWIFLLDTAFVIFNNAPPRMVIREMKIHLAVPDSCFNAPTADQCYDQLKLSRPPCHYYWRMFFEGVFKSLCSADITMDLRHNLASLGLLNLFALISAIHAQIFQHRNSCGTVQLLLPIQNALRNWRGIWQLASMMPTDPVNTINADDLLPDKMWERYGFWKYCFEYWLFANLVVGSISDLSVSPIANQIETGQGDSEYLRDDFVEPILNKYDQTSMRQVNDLISSFQNCQI